MQGILQTPLGWHNRENACSYKHLLRLENGTWIDVSPANIILAEISVFSDDLFALEMAIQIGYHFVSLRFKLR